MLEKTKYNPPTFQTHLHYVKCVDGLFCNLKLEIGVRATKQLDGSKIIKYDKLSRITFDSIETEIKQCNSVPEYSQVVAPWLPVKCYYYIYYLECILLYLLNGNTKVFGHGGHTEVRNVLKKAISEKELVFSNEDLSAIKTYKTIMEHKLISGQNLKKDFYSTDDCKKSLRLKLVLYDCIDFKIKEKIKRMSPSQKIIFENKNLTLFDYFYQMRIKANYRDVDFLDFENEITAQEALIYIGHYFTATKSYGLALKSGINSLLRTRGMKL